RRAKRRDVAGEADLLHVDPGPYGFHELLFGDQPAGVLQQNQECLEDLGVSGTGSSVSAPQVNLADDGRMGREDRGFFRGFETQMECV
ncbi:MAG TPA: hypothetical protein VEK15_26285, partial [Vicinamibacteria bacterium]|nr:hypothetical protein [Vicinamibacteria bacterium]